MLSFQFEYDWLISDVTGQGCASTSLICVTVKTTVQNMMTSATVTYPVRYTATAGDSNSGARDTLTHTSTHIYATSMLHSQG